MVVGWLFYCSDRVNCRRRWDLERDGLEALSVEIKTSRKKPLLVCSIYCPPDSGKQFLEVFSDTMECAVTEGKEVLLMGNLNINLLRS